jgi:hypothetical protein
MLRRTLLTICFAAAALPAHAQALGDIRGHIEPYDNRSARFLNSYPQTEDQAFVPYQTASAAQDYGAVTVYKPYLGPERMKEYASAKYADSVPRMYAPVQPDRSRDMGGIAEFLSTRAGLEFGLSLSNYGYTEPYVPQTAPPGPGVRVEIDGLRYGGHLAGTFTFGDPLHLDGDARWFFTAETRFSYASTDYKGSGESKDKDDYLSESRLTFGHDFTAGQLGFSPFVGVGYRYLFNDMRGLTSTGAGGYRRESQYLYMPLGLTTRADLFGDGSRVSLSAEFDMLLYGRQKSYLNDIALGDPITNKQDKGHGVRVSAAYERGNWSVGPYFNYWNISRSDDQCNGTVCGFEPRNHTLEYGLKAGYRFWNF